MEQYGKQGQSVDELVQAQIRKAKSNGRTIDYDTAYEEVIADSMESMLTDGKVIEKLQQLYKLTMSVGKNGTVNTVYNVGKIKEARSPFSGSKAVTDKSATTVTASDINIPNYQQNVNNDFNSPKSFKIAEDGKTTVKKGNTQQAVEIQRIESIGENGTINLKLNNGDVVDAADISYADNSEALVYETVTDLTADVSSANAIVGIFKAAKPSSPRAWLAGAAAVYTDGMYNIPYAEVATQDFTDNLTESEKQFLYNLGKEYSKAKANAEENRLKMQKSAIKKTARKKGKVTLNGKENFNTKGFTDVQRASLSYANILSEITGVEVRLFESEKVNGRFVYTDENGEVKAAPNGKYIPGSNIIMLDINSGIKGEGTMLYTLSHELTHFIKEWSPAKFQSLANFLMEQYGKQGQSVDELVQAQIRKAKSNGRTIDYDTAYEEVIADSMESMLTDGKVIEKLQQLYKQDKTLFEKISDFINKWVDKVKQIYSRYSPNSKEGKLILEMKDSLEELQSKFAEAIYAASENAADSSKESDSTTQNPTSNLDMRYDDREYFVEDKYFKSQMSKWEELNHGSYIKVGVIGEKHPLHLIGMPNGVLRYDVDKLKKNMSDHSDYLTVDLLKAIPDIIANPMAISEYSEENTVSVFGDVFIGKSPMMVGVTISRDRAGNDISKVRTYNTRRDVGNLISDQSILYLNEDKKRTRKWFQACGIQVPLGETKFGFIRSVSQIPDAVKLSDRDYSFDPELVADLQADRDKLKSDVDNLKELLKLQQTVTHGTVFTKTSVNAAASKLMKTFGMNQGKAELATALNEFYRFVASSEDLSWESVMTEAGKVADRVIELVPAREQRNDYSEKILKEIRNKGISLTDEQKTEIANKYDSYNNFRKSHMGSMVFSDKGISLEKQWQEWAELYPDVFDKDVTAADMPEALSDIVSDLRLTRKMVKELDTAESRQMMLNEIYDSYWGVSTLHTLADRHQKQVNLLKSKHNAQMSELRAEYKEREKKTAQRYQEMIKRIREHKNRQMEEYKVAVRESRQNATESRHRTEMRNKIKKVVNELNQYLKGTKEKHVSEGMQTAVAEALSVINMDTVDADARVAEYNARIEKATDPIVIEALTATRDRIQAQGDNLKNKLEALQLGYAKIKQSSDPSLASAYNKGIEDKIASVVDVVGNTPLRNMSMNQLEEVYDLYKLVLTSIRDRNKMFVAAQKETVQELGIEAKTELSEVSKKIEYINSVNKLLRKIGYKDLKPIYFFRMLGSKTMTKLYKAVSNGQGTWYKDMREAKSFRIKAEKEYNYKNWDMKKTYSFTSNSGSSFKLTLQQIMSIYAYYRRDEEKAIRHLVDGGFVYDKSISVIKKEKGVPVKYYVNTAEAFNLSEAIINEIISTLSDEQRAYVEKMQAYLSDTMGAKGNEVSLKLYDVKLFKEKNYFPIKSSSTYMDYNPEESGEVKIKNSGFTKATNQFANNPIVLDDFLNIWTSHVNDMSMYHAFVLPLEDFTRVYNYRNITDRRGAIQATIETNYTEVANSYIKQLLKDINGGSVSGVGTEVIDKMVGLAKKGAVFASASVVVQQPSAIARAMAYVNPKYFVNVSSFNLKRHNQLWEECKQYAPVAGIKEMGYFDTSVGRTGIDWLKADEYDSVREKFFAFFKDKEQRRNIFDDALSFAPAMADELSWVALWEAVKKETRKTTNLEVGSEEFFKHCGERFTEVVDLTQVYDSVFARSELMRSKDRSVKMATSFMAEPTTQANMLFDAVLQLKRGKKSALAPAAATIGAVVGSVVLNSILKSFVLAGRDDDEDETYLEKYVASFTGDVLSGLNPLTLIPFVKDIISIAQGYSVERMDTSVVEDIIGSIMDLGKDTKSDAEKALGLIGSVANLFGVPAKNIIRDFNSAINVFNTFSRGDKTTGTDIKFALLEGLSETVTANLIKGVTGEGINTKKGKKYYDAIVSGDNDYIQKNKSDESVINSFKTLVKEKVESGEISVEKGANMLSNYGGVDEEKAFENAQYYDFSAQHPDLTYDWSASTVASYLETAEPSGISVKVYDEYLVKKKECKGTDNDGDGKADRGSVKIQVIQVINSLPITSRQKAVLYQLNGY